MYPPHHLGGYEQSCRDVVDRWRGEGNEISVLTTDFRLAGVTDPPNESARGVHRTLRFYWDDHRIISPPPHRRLAIERHNQSELRRILAGFRPDVVSVWHMGAMSMGLLTAIERARIPMVLVVCDDWMVYGPEVDAWSRVMWRRPGVARIAQRVLGLPALPPSLSATATCFVSSWTMSTATRESTLQFRRPSVVYSGIDTADFPIRPREARPWSWRLLYVGRVEPRKGVHVAVRALGSLPATATLRIVGPAEAGYRDELERIARDSGVADRVTFAERDRSELHTEHDAADALIFPVLWDEPFGLVPVEAMASGMAVVATSGGGSTEFLVDEGNCLVVPRDDHLAVASAVHRLSADADLRGRLALGSVATATELTVDRLADVLMQWHRFAANGFTGEAPAPRPRIEDVLTARGLIGRTGAGESS
jgi:glycosyltransferase involved in cell wall biosynthesis